METVRTVWMRVVAFVTVFCILSSLAIVDRGSLFGHRFGEDSAAKGDSVISYVGETEVINTTALGRDISGYGGPVPVQIYVTGGRIDSIHSLPNSESPGFFGNLASSGLTRAWNGKSLDEAAVMQVDAVSGATYSSTAYIANVRAGIDYAISNGSKVGAHEGGGWSVPLVIALVVILCGAVIPLFLHNPIYRFIQQLLNVAVLGFWAGTFIDYAMMLNFFAGGFGFSLAYAVTLVLMVVGFIYPLLGKGTHYCSWICPLGSLQDLAGHLSGRKLKIGARTALMLDNLRQLLWVVLLLLLYIGWGTEWIDNELFTAFMVKSASWIVMVIGGLFVILSIFVPRPFCRFVCPTGTILKDA